MENEKRLIEANETTENLAKNAGHILRHADGDDYAVGRARGIMDAVDLINKLTPVDAVEVVHGRWVCLEAEIGYFACSECDHRILRAKCNYCPHCGAKMDGGNEDAER